MVKGVTDTHAMRLQLPVHSDDASRQYRGRETCLVSPARLGFAGRNRGVGVYYTQ